jgi:hypothetical protein
MTRPRRSLTTGSTSSSTEATDRDTPQSKRYRRPPIRHNPASAELVEQQVGVGHPRPIAPPAAARSGLTERSTVPREESAACYRIAGEMRATRTALPDPHQGRGGGVSRPDSSRPPITLGSGLSLALTHVADALARPAERRRLGPVPRGALAGCVMIDEPLRAARWPASGLVSSFGQVGQLARRVRCRRS